MAGFMSEHASRESNVCYPPISRQEDCKSPSGPALLPGPLFGNLGLHFNLCLPLPYGVPGHRSPSACDIDHPSSAIPSLGQTARTQQVLCLPPGTPCPAPSRLSPLSCRSGPSKASHTHLAPWTGYCNTAISRAVLCGQSPSSRSPWRLTLPSLALPCVLQSPRP